MIPKAIEPIDGNSKLLPTLRSQKRGLKILRRTGFGIAYTALSILAVTKSGWGQLAFNKALQEIDLVPTPVVSKEVPFIRNDYHIDSFFNNQQVFPNVLDSIPYGINLSDLDLNQNKTILDTQEEVRQLENELLQARKSYAETPLANKVLEAQIELAKTNILNLLLWGDSAEPNNLFQGGRPNCQIMGAIQSHLLTPENLQTLKNTIEVTDYNLNIENFYIDTIVHLNGHDVEVPFEDLVKWMSPRNILPSLSSDGRLAIPILTYALEKTLVENHEKKFPPSIPSSAQILISGKDYSLIGVSPFFWNLLTDKELIEILSKAPQVPILVSRSGKLKDLPEIIEDFSKSLYREDKPFEFLPYSGEKAVMFVSLTSSRAGEITTNITSSETIQVNEINNIQRAPTEYFPSNHMFVVKGYDQETQKILLIDSHGVEYKPLTIGEFKEKIDGMIIPTKDIPLITGESIKAYLLLLLFASGHITILKKKKEA